ncbi:hypothetical protein [uncultured Paraglaciecola sp.]|uniref:hypothetical protein n=1 Tax=uncultured Paraglaciecola sp. TaxID=1765024 RepID=UPI00260CF6FE|nr:hypothetical protein [uncultured Paraglaciecola sp.]
MSENKALNPFSAKTPEAVNTTAPVNAAATSDQARAIQEVTAALMIAKQCPRDPIQAVDRIINSCARPTLANAALYEYARGGTAITGPSIRLAEAVAQQWGNMQFGIRELSQENGASTVEAFAWDVETNTRQTKQFQVKHWRDTKKGGYALKDQRDIYELIANQGARRLRACILGVVPGDVIEAAVNQCMLTQQADVDTSPDAIKAMLSAFRENYKVGQDQIEARIQRRIDAIQPGQVLQLRRIYKSLADGMAKPSDFFDGVTEAPPVTESAVNAALEASGTAAVEEKKVDDFSSDIDF